MEIIIIGAGKVGEYLVNELSNEGHDIVVIEKNKEILDRILSENDVMGVCGNGANHDILIEAGVEHCDILIAVTLEDDVNIIASVMAKKLGTRYTIARVRDPHYMNHMEFMQKSMGVDLLVNPEYQAAKEIQRTLKYPYASNVESFLKGKVNMIQVEVEEDSFIAGKTLNELNSNRNIGRVLVTIVSRNDEVFIPNGSFKIMPGDSIHVAGTREDLGKFYWKLSNSHQRIQSVMLIGAGRIAFYLTKLLIDRGFDVKVIENNKQKSIDFLEDHPQAIVVNADGSNPEILEEERITSYDAIVSMTGIDEENILISLIAERFGVPKIIAKVDRLSLLRITGILDLDTTITPKRSIANIILRLVRSKENIQGSEMKNLYRLEDNRVEALEFDIRDDSKITSIPLKDLDLKSGTLIAYIMKNGKVIVPGGNDTIEKGDRVVMVTKDIHFNEIDDILE
ncbi:MAG: Trk system potassium transporter TrkA [Tissierellia bacterium]|nr:Trk system potassium transporter TrkA [Tissierellia bacterium]